MGLATIIGAVGAVLLLVGLVGGGFEFSGSVMPKVGKFARVLCFTIGGFMVLVSIGLAVGEGWQTPEASADTPPSQEPPASSSPLPPLPEPPPSVGYIMVGSGYTAYVFEMPSLDAGIVTEVSDGSEVHILCTTQGESVTSPVTGYTSSLWNFTTDGGFIPDVAVATGTDQPTMPNCLE